MYICFFCKYRFLRDKLPILDFNGNPTYIKKYGCRKGCNMHADKCLEYSKRTILPITCMKGMTQRMRYFNKCATNGWTAYHFTEHSEKPIIGSNVIRKAKYRMRKRGKQ